MKNISIYSICSYDSGKSIGRCCVSLEYKGKFKYMSFHAENNVSNRSVVTGVVEAIKTLKEPCMVTIVTTVPLGVAKWENKRSGTNAGLLSELHNEAFEKSCVLKFDVREGQSEAVRELAQSSNAY